MRMYTRHTSSKRKCSVTNSKPPKCGSRKRGSYNLKQVDIDFLYKYGLEEFITSNDIEMIEWSEKNEIQN